MRTDFETKNSHFRRVGALVVCICFLLCILWMSSQGSSNEPIQYVATTQDEPLKAAIIVLFGGKQAKKEYFLQYTLPSVELYFLSCHKNKYPLHIFFEDMTAEEKSNLRALVPSASHVVFEDVSHFWQRIPHQIAESQIEKWERMEKYHHPRNYRTMCRFWAGLVWQMPSMQQYDYYWRLDTDSMLLGPTMVDPFEHLVETGCQYAWNELHYEDAEFATEMGTVWERWAAVTMTPKVRERVFKLTHDNGKFWAPMYYNNFEIGSMRLKNHPTYKAFFKYVDENPPFGIYQYRWGDAPLHTLGIYSVLEGNIAGKVCEFNKTLIPYAHPGPRDELNFNRQCVKPSSP